MTKSSLIIIPVLLVLAASISCGPDRTSGTAGERPPNIILIMADDLGYGDIGCFGNTRINTPHLDSMAARGIRFTDYHSNGVVCTPTRAALMTGRYQQRAGLEGVIYVQGETRQTGLDTAQVTLAEVLNNRGYRTGILGKWHLGYRKPYNPVKQGFDLFRGFVSGNIDYHSHYDNATIYDWWHDLDSVVEPGYATDLITGHALEFIEKNREQPFFLYVAHAAPHWPYQGRGDKPDRLPGLEHDPRGSRTDRDQAYREMVEVMDEGIGKIMASLREKGLEEQTLVIFCSDNGGVPELGNNGTLNGHKGTVWEGGHRVPAIVCWKGQIDPGTSDQTVMGMDVFPTIRSIAGITGPSGPDTDGRDLSGLLLSGEKLPERHLVWRYRNQKAVRRGPYKLLILPSDTLLFHLGEDPGETRDLSAELPGTADSLRNYLKDWEWDMDHYYIQKTR